MSSSLMPSRNLTIARMELPCAQTNTVLPALSCGAMDSSQYGSTRAMVSLRHSVSGMSLGSRPAYLASFFGWNSESASIGGGGMSKLRRQTSTWSAPCFCTVSFLSRPVRPPYIRSFRRQVLATGQYSCSAPSRAMLQVLMARFRKEVWEKSRVTPASFSSSPAALASPVPFTERSTSTQPVKRLATFHSDSPWREKIRVAWGAMMCLARSAL
mmetsp:Transcript_78434/g.201982  ORF Transcript_78434/g.201982 Transcript_78434/m.201982 type:complete len:213 (-) Transcript_78434:57-695(-)